MAVDGARKLISTAIVKMLKFDTEGFSLQEMDRCLEVQEVLYELLPLIAEYFPQSCLEAIEEHFQNVPDERRYKPIAYLPTKFGYQLFRKKEKYWTDSVKYIAVWRIKVAPIINGKASDEGLFHSRRAGRKVGVFRSIAFKARASKRREMGKHARRIYKQLLIDREKYRFPDKEDEESSILEQFNKQVSRFLTVSELTGPENIVEVKII